MPSPDNEPDDLYDGGEEEEEEEEEGGVELPSRIKWSKESEEREKGQVEVPYEVDRSRDETARRQEIANKFVTQTTAIKDAKKEIARYLENRIYKKDRLYASMSKADETKFLDALGKVNENLGASQTMLDSYVEFDKSTPEFKNFFNKFFHLHELITAHRRSLFYNHNARKGMYLYPLIEIETRYGGLDFLFARLIGHLMMASEYIKDLPYIQPQPMTQGVEGGGGYGGGGGYYPHTYPQLMRPDYYGSGDDRFGFGGSRKPKEEFRDIGDRLDQG